MPLPFYYLAPMAGSMLLGLRARMRTGWVLAWLGALAALGCWSCRGQDVRTIPQADFEALLLEVYCINGLADMNDSVRNLYETGKLELYAKAVAQRGYTMAQFDSTLMECCRDSKAFRAILTNVLERLKVLEDSAMRLHKQASLAKLEADSLAVITSLSDETE